MNEPIGRFGSPNPGTIAAHRIGHRAHRMLLADHAVGQTLLHLQQFFALSFEHAGDGNAGPSRNHAGDFIRRHFVPHQRVTIGLQRCNFCSAASMRALISRFSPY